MSLGLLAPAMLWGLAAIAIPVVIHLLNRRRATTIDWGAMQFLQVGRRARRKFQVTELLLMAGRMLLLAVVALALARPFVGGAAGKLIDGNSTQKRDIVLIIDGSASMDHRGDAGTPREAAIRWARRFVRRLSTGDSVGVLVARDRVAGLVDPPSFDLSRVESALKGLPAARGSSDLAAAVAEALRLLERGKNPGRDIVILTDGRRHAWRPGESARWDLLRELRRSQPIPARLWAVELRPEGAVGGADGSVGALELGRGLATPNQPIEVRATVSNAGPSPLKRDAELLLDGAPIPGQRQAVGPVPPGGKSPVVFRATIAATGSHLLTVRLAAGDDPQPADDEASRPVEVAAALPVLLVDGEPSAEPLGGEADFLRAALAPTGDDTPQVKTTVVRADRFEPSQLRGQRVLVLANVDRLDPARASAVADLLSAGGGVLVAPGDRVDVNSYNDMFYRDGDGWLPAKLGATRGDPSARKSAAHPSPRTFLGPALSPFGKGDAPPLGEADLFTYRLLEPAVKPPAATVAARLDTGDPWVVERPYRRGRSAILAGPVDAEGGTLPVNPDFVPWAHELVLRLADPAAGATATRPGEAIEWELADLPAPAVVDAEVLLPDGRTARAAITRAGGRARARVDVAEEPGAYRLTLPEPAGGFAYAVVEGDPGEADPAPLEPAERAALSRGWPLAFEADPAALDARVLAGGVGGPRPLWRGLVLLALGGLCLEVWLTRRLVRGRGIADLGGDG